MPRPFQEILNGKTARELFLTWVETNTQPYKELMAYYKCALMEIETKFNVLNEELSLKYDRNPIESIKSRIKSPESILKKMERYDVFPTVESIESTLNDIAGMRVGCFYLSDVYMFADALLEQDDVTLVKRKDYIEHPKENGYRSLHLIVETPIFLHDSKKLMKVEVQLRTMSMDMWASLEHKILYKKDMPEEIAARLTKELGECATEAARLDKRMGEIQTEANLYLDGAKE